MVSGHFHKRTAGLMMIHCVQLGFETVQMGERKPKQMEKKEDSPVFLFKSEHLDFSKAFPCRDTFKPPRCCAAAMAYPSVILMFGREPLLFLWWIVERALQVLCFFIYFWPTFFILAAIWVNISITVWIFIIELRETLQGNTALLLPFPQDENTPRLPLLLPWKPGHSHSFIHTLRHSLH